ncbi:MAG: DciA family protein [Candidatus Peribacteraceae bacterium]|jgi:hypothetical protein
MDSLKSILPKVLRKRGLHAHAVASMVTYRSQKWLKESLPRLKDAIAVHELSDAVLTVECGNGIALQECRFQIPALTAYLSRECPETPIREIRVIRTSRRGGS